ncbi:MAG: 3'-5' exonuclease [Chromatiales bacterium 21-64-14]|nr:MAG: 3'-5' exonuclease [Chromatiales bacterium 21-64-14]HQU16676.1 3'-5' exonuclease [Gammaproteobacteria bacterium]
MNNVFVFDIETVPDVEAGRRLYGLDGLSDGDVAQVMYTVRRQQTGGNDFLRLHLQRVVAISLAVRTRDWFKVWSLGEVDAPEAELVRRFFDGVERYTPTLVSWNGGGFDLPVLHYRALRHGIPAPRYWETGADDQGFRWNNYLNRFHERHTDLMDVLSGYQARAVAPLDEIATLLGLPGKMGMDGAQVWERYLEGELGAIRDYCETDVINTYLVYLRFEQIRGRLGAEEYQRECQLVRDTLNQDDRPHLRRFLAAWPAPQDHG